MTARNKRVSWANSCSVGGIPGQPWVAVLRVDRSHFWVGLYAYLYRRVVPFGTAGQEHLKQIVDLGTRNWIFAPLVVLVSDGILADRVLSCV